MAALFVRAKGRHGNAHQRLARVLQLMKESIPQPASVWDSPVGRLSAGRRAANRLVSGTGAVDQTREFGKRPPENPEAFSITLHNVPYDRSGSVCTDIPRSCHENLHPHSIRYMECGQ